MALVAHRMMLPARHRRTHQQLARNKVGVLVVPSVAEFYNNSEPQPKAQLQVEAAQQHFPVNGDNNNGKVSATS
ncbi:uncharacterized protein LOC115626622 [Scaptodrosophila lebanonensis]|uniref:Uncharacterized protein LOC115626622 n=1 Tax=Drosophila lebanonensis TaxID=7225 RepID=A0A6J2TQU6_DROLE|nr:uncharacterized protein LOC115626622 [Scaptodrosophila lebanonensis]